MKKLVLTALFLAAAQAYGYCETEAANHIANKYQVTPVETRDLVRNCGGEGGVDREVWVKASDDSSYSVFFWGCDCSYIKRDIKW